MLAFAVAMAFSAALGSYMLKSEGSPSLCKVAVKLARYENVPSVDSPSELVESLPLAMTVTDILPVCSAMTNGLHRVLAIISESEAGTRKLRMRMSGHQ